MGFFAKHPEGGDDFKKMFVLYAVLVTNAPLLDFRFMGSIYFVIADATAIHNNDWCSIFLDKLSEAVNSANAECSTK